MDGAIKLGWVEKCSDCQGLSQRSLVNGSFSKAKSLVLDSKQVATIRLELSSPDSRKLEGWVDQVFGESQVLWSS